MTNLLNVLIRHIRSGNIDLTPTRDSGWYDFQTYALETLLLPDRAKESDKLLLSEGYKRHYLEAFKTVMTKNRELHAKQLEPTYLGMSVKTICYHVKPKLQVEPTATCYLRTASAYLFLNTQIQEILGSEALYDISVGTHTLHERIQEMIRLMVGLHLVVMDDIGMTDSLDDVAAFGEIKAARESAQQFLETVNGDPAYATDVRFAVPIMQDRNRTRYWTTCGIKLMKVQAEYAVPPEIRFIVNGVEAAPSENNRVQSGRHSFTFKLLPSEYYMPVEVFGEMDGSKEPLTRSEFRALCDAGKSVAGIKKAMECQAIGRVGRNAILAVVGVLIVVALLASSWWAIKHKRFRFRLSWELACHSLLLVIVSIGLVKTILWWEDRQSLMKAVIAQDSEDVKAFLQKGTNPHITTVAGETLLGLACRGGTQDIVEQLIDSGIDINATGYYCVETPLSIAALGGHKQVCEVLVRNGASLSNIDLLLKNAALSQSEETVIWVIHQLNTSRPYVYMADALEAVTKEGMADMVVFLLENGAQIDQGTRDDSNGSLYVACTNGRLQVAQELIGNGALIRGCHLNAAICGGNTELLKYLLKIGPGSDCLKEEWIAGEAGRSALSCASQYESAAAIKVLLDAGAFYGADQTLKDEVKRVMNGQKREYPSYIPSSYEIFMERYCGLFLTTLFVLISIVWSILFWGVFRNTPESERN